MLSVTESAELLHISPARVRALVAKGTLPAQKIGRVWTLKEEDVMQRVVQKPRSGRPRASESENDGYSKSLAQSLAHTHEAYNLCKQYLSGTPSDEELAHIKDANEARFRIAVAKYFQK